jgi:hypothetical protein
MSSTGLKEGNFTLLNVLKDGVFQDVTTFAGGGSGAVQTASAPLSITAGNLSLDTSALVTTSAECAKIGSADCNHGANDFQCQSLTLTSPDNSEHEITCGDDARLVVAGSKPLLANSITVGTGLFALASNPNGFLSIALTGAEARTQLRLQDPAATVRALTSNISGELLWDGGALPSSASVASSLALKQDDLSVTQTSTITTFDRDITVSEPGNNPSVRWSVPGGEMRFLLQSNFNAGLNCPGNFSITTGGSNYHLPILCVGPNLTCAGTITAAGYISSSDQSIKENIEDADTAAALAMLDAVSARTYQRTDIAGDRLGFVANEVQALCPPEWANVVHTQEDGLLAIDYSRISCILWQICKNQEARIKALEAV